MERRFTGMLALALVALVAVAPDAARAQLAGRDSFSVNPPAAVNPNPGSGLYVMPRASGPNGSSCISPGPGLTVVGQAANGQCLLQGTGNTGTGRGNFSSNMGLQTQQNHYAPQPYVNNQARYQATGRDPNGIPINTNGPITFEWRTVPGVTRGMQLVQMHNGTIQRVVPPGSERNAIMRSQHMLAPGQADERGLNQATLDRMHRVQHDHFDGANSLAPGMGVQPFIMGAPNTNYDYAGFGTRYAPGGNPAR